MVISHLSTLTTPYRSALGNETSPAAKSIKKGSAIVRLVWAEYTAAAIRRNPTSAMDITATAPRHRQGLT